MLLTGVACDTRLTVNTYMKIMYQVSKIITFVHAVELFKQSQGVWAQA